MKSLEVRLSNIRTLMAAYSTFTNIPNVDFDENGLLSLRFDDVELALSLGPKQAEIVIRAALDLRQTTITQGLMANLLSANVISIKNGMGTVGIDTDAGSWVWIDRFDPAPMSVEDFHNRLLWAVEAVRMWRSQIAELAANNRIEPGPDYDQPIFRL